MGFIMIDVMEHESELLSPILQTVNLVGALVFALIPFLVRSLILSDARIKARLERDVYLEVLAINPQTRELDPERVERIKALEPFEQRLLSLPTFHWFIYAISLARPHSKSLSSVRFKVLRHGRTSLWLAGFGFQAAGAADEQVLSAAIGVACCTIRIFAAVWSHTHPVVLFSPSFKAVRFRPPVPVPPGGVSSSV